MKEVNGVVKSGPPPKNNSLGLRTGANGEINPQEALHHEVNREAFCHWHQGKQTKYCVTPVER